MRLNSTSGINFRKTILDEPTIGLHELEKQKFMDMIRELIGCGNTVIAVEHGAGFIRNADYIVEIGPGAGESGGNVVFQGSLEEYMRCADSCTTPYLRGEESIIEQDFARRVDHSRVLSMKHCRTHIEMQCRALFIRLLQI